MAHAECRDGEKEWKIPDISQGENERFNIFGVFDGHGGKEVSTFV